MSEYLKHLSALDYVPPTLGLYEKDGVEVKLSDLKTIWKLFVDGIPWMAYCDRDHKEAYEVYSHYDLAHGHVITTGLGFGARERWILNKPGVTKLTVLEAQEGVINYHKDIGSDFLNDIELINVNAEDYKGSCDVLLLDHYEGQVSFFHMTQSISNVCSNIKHDVMWFWPIERFISGNMSKCLPHKTMTENYNYCKMLMPSLAEVDTETLRRYCTMFHMCEWELV